MTYVRMYETEQKAQAAITQLKKGGFPENAIHLVTPGARGDAILGYMIGNDTRVYAENLALGRSFVLVRAAFGSGQAAIDILDSCGPIDSDLLAPAQPANCWEEAVTPLSTAMQWQVLKQNDPAPFSRWMGFPLLSKGDKPAPLSKWLGSPLLSKQSEPGPFSSRMGFPLLSPEVSLSQYFGLDLLSPEATPLSSRLGLETLVGLAAIDEASHDPAPLTRYPQEAPTMAEEAPQPAVVAAADDPEEPRDQAAAPAWGAPGEEVIEAAPLPEPPGGDPAPQNTVPSRARSRAKSPLTSS